MRHRPIVLRLLAAFILAFGLMGSIVTPSLAQDASTPTPNEPAAQTDDDLVDSDGGVTAADVLTGSLQLYYYLCDGGIDFAFDASSAPGAGNPTPPDSECALASNVGGTDRTFYVYEFGDLNSTPHEVTTLDGVGTQVLPVTVGTPHLILEHVPPLPEEIEATSHEPQEASFEIVVDTVTGVNAAQFQTGTLAFHTYVCEGDPETSSITAIEPGGSFDDSLYAACDAGTQSFTVTPFGDEATYGTTTTTTVDGEGTANDVPATSVDSGNHTIAQDDSDLTTEFQIAAGQTTVVYAVNYVAGAEPTGDLTVFKLTCVGEGETEFFIDEPAVQQAGGECWATVASFSIYPFGDTEADPIQFDTEEDGFKDVSGLAVTDGADPHLLVEESTGAETTFTIVEGATTVVNVVNYEPPAPADGTVEIDKLACTGLAWPVFEVGNPGDDAIGVPGNCYGASADFLIYLFSDEEADPIEITIDGSDTLDLPPTDGTSHLIVELDGAGDWLESATFEIESETVTPVQVQNPTYGFVEIFSFLCEGEDDSFIEVYEPGETPELPTDCMELDRDFDITLFGAGETKTFGAVYDGTIRIGDVPTTDVDAHLIETSDDGAEADFYVDEGETTAIVAYAFEVEEADDTDDSETVEELADTGTGPATPRGDGAALLYGLLSVIAIAGFSTIARRRNV